MVRLLCFSIGIFMFGEKVWKFGLLFLKLNGISVFLNVILVWVSVI